MHHPFHRSVECRCFLHAGAGPQVSPAYLMSESLQWVMGRHCSLSCVSTLIVRDIHVTGMPQCLNQHHTLRNEKHLCISYINWRHCFWFGMGKPLVYIRRNIGSSRSILSNSIPPISIGQQQNSVNINCCKNGIKLSNAIPFS